MESFENIIFFKQSKLFLMPKINKNLLKLYVLKHLH